MPGKFAGERTELVEAYEAEVAGRGQESFGDVEGRGYYFHSYARDGSPVFGRVNSDGFVTEITLRAYLKAQEDEEQEQGDGSAE